jgi:poly-gamma-glutamate capsule biosynthesis protein CapA/YwtB (metallophosphatase superfamily)
MKKNNFFKGFLLGSLFLLPVLFTACSSGNNTDTVDVLDNIPNSTVTVPPDTLNKVAEAEKEAIALAKKEAEKKEETEKEKKKPAKKKKASPKKEKYVVKTPSTPPPTPDPSGLISIVGVGDMMLGTNYPSANYLPANGGKNLLSDLKDKLWNADITFGNLEGTILDSGGTVKRCSNPDLCYAFRSPESYVQHFVDAGFDVLSIANNHTGDFGNAGRKKTKEVLKNAGIEFAGLAGTDEYTVFEKNGVKYGFAAFAPNSGTCDIRNISKAKQIVQKLEEMSDIVIVSFHGGAEGSSHQHTPCITEKYVGENRGNVCKFAHAVVDAGADIVFGHGPHVTRAMELYNDRFIIYSLGNFCTYGRFNLRGATGIAPLLKVYVDNSGAFSHAEITPVYQAKTHGPKIDSKKRAIKKLQELTNEDFPNSGLDIYDDGTVVKR